jgi:20S proteasome alpha/beta subunit
LVSRLENDLHYANLDVSAIIAGVDSTGPHIYHVQEPGGQVDSVVSVLGSSRGG